MWLLIFTKRNYWLPKTMMETYRSNASSRLGCPSTPFQDTHISPSIAYIQLVIFSLELLSIGFGSLLAWKPTYLSFHYGQVLLEGQPANSLLPGIYRNSLDLDGIYWMEASLPKGDVHVPNSNSLSCPSRTAYSLVLLIGSGIGPIGALSGLKGFILLNSSGLRQRVKNRYSQHVVRLRLLLLSRCSQKYRSTECEDRLD
jgi:hypothetical protein